MKIQRNKNEIQTIIACADLSTISTSIEQIEKMEKTVGRVLRITKQQAWKRAQKR